MPSTLPLVSVAHSLAAPFPAVSVTPVPPIAYAFALNSLVSTAPPVVVAHSFAAPRDAVVVTSVPPMAHAFALYPTSEALASLVTASVVSVAQSCAFPA